MGMIPKAHHCPDGSHTEELPAVMNFHDEIKLNTQPVDFYTDICIDGI